METVACLNCGLPRALEISSMPIRPPCERCGSNAISIHLEIKEKISIFSQCISELTPGKQDRDWKQRWDLIQNDFKQVTAPCLKPMCSEEIHILYQRLCSFYIHAYHLKDALIASASLPRLSKSVIEKEITNDKRLAILADLANLDKNCQLTRNIRSGAVPIIQISGIDDPLGNGWSLSVKIHHGNNFLDGIGVAGAALKAWREKLNMWGLI